MWIYDLQPFTAQAVYYGYHRWGMSQAESLAKDVDAPSHTPLCELRKLAWNKAQNDYRAVKMARRK